MYRKMDLKPSAVLLCVFFQLFNVAFSMEEGSPCTMSDGTEGVCLSPFQCFHTTEDLKNFVLPTFCSLRIWNPIVCCRDCRFIQNRFFDGLRIQMSFTFQVDFLITDKVQMNHKHCLDEFHFACNKYEKYKDMDDSVRCYESPTSAEDIVIGGYDPQRDGYPHLALIGYGDNPLNADWVCTGAVINEYYILTAAHCTSFLALGVLKMAALGVTNRSAHDPRNWQTYEIVNIILHPNYEPPSKYHDIALLMTGVEIRFNKEVIPACLHREMEMSNEATAVGWGAMNAQNSLTEILKGVDIYQLSDKECMEAYPEHRFLIHGFHSSTQACYGDVERIDDYCEGDNGGPLQMLTNLPRSRCLHMIMGVTTYGRACGSFGSAGLYTRVAYYVPWIESITGNLI